MTGTLIISIATCLLMILGVIFKPVIKIKHLHFDSYWVIVLIGALSLLVLGYADAEKVFSAMTTNTAVNPIKIAVLFISMTVISVFLDEMGFFKYVANAALKHSGRSQMKLFLYFYLTVSVLTVFTSNDIIILTFTPFICYFAKHAGISPVPYIISEFVAANTWSMALIIGNPTNVYLATIYGVDFVEYAKIMLLPTILAGTTAFFILWLIFHKQLKKEMDPDTENIEIKDKTLLAIGLIHLCVCTVLLAVASYLDWEMWLISLSSVISLYFCVAVVNIFRRRSSKVLISCTKRAPWALVPFILSMFVIILAINDSGVTKMICDSLGHGGNVFAYGISSAFSANVINNIPMSVLYSSILENLTGIEQIRALFAVIIGSNIGALLTPIGALAGIMWSSILKTQGVRFGYRDFIKYGFEIGVPTLITALIGMFVMLG